MERKTTILIGIAAALVLIVGVTAAVLIRRGAIGPGSTTGVNGATNQTPSQNVNGGGVNGTGPYVPPPDDPTKATQGTPKPNDGDLDYDGLSDDEEATLGTNPNKADTDGDGLFDGDEVNVLHTDPKTPNAPPAR